MRSEVMNGSVRSAAMSVWKLRTGGLMRERGMPIGCKKKGGERNSSIQKRSDAGEPCHLSPSRPFVIVERDLPRTETEQGVQIDFDERHSKHNRMLDFEKHDLPESELGDKCDPSVVSRAER
jgi:hypothetical protein